MVSGLFLAKENWSKRERERRQRLKNEIRFVISNLKIGSYKKERKNQRKKDRKNQIKKERKKESKKERIKKERKKERNRNK